DLDRSAPSAVSRCNGSRRGSGSLLNAEGLGEPPIGLEVVAVLAVAGGVLGAGEQEAIAVGRRAVRPVVEQAEAELLVVGVVAGLGRAAGQRADESPAVVAGLEIGGRPVDGLG